MIYDVLTKEERQAPMAAVSDECGTFYELQPAQQGSV